MTSCGGHPFWIARFCNPCSEVTNLKTNGQVEYKYTDKDCDVDPIIFVNRSHMKAEEKTSLHYY